MPKKKIELSLPNTKEREEELDKYCYIFFQDMGLGFLFSPI